MTLRWEQVVIDCADPAALGRWWAEALGWVTVLDDPGAGEYEIRPAPEVLPGLLFGASPDGKAGKNRLHLDFRPADQRTEVDRLLALGARHADVGQSGEESWVVLQDPEGNEFCVLSARTD
ncbi:VOC family protein [Streptomyces sp. NPDC048290]|uniref:VOC family protein n=1 Tax=Streptomyces sp. NPDC048290 TaxID=3155811 RepID=UPI003432250D